MFGEEYREKTCKGCGKAFVPKSGRQERCPDCAKARIKEQQAMHYERKRAAKLERIRAKSDRIREKHPCPYCGHMTKRDYCASCHFQGFDNVHRMFGITNGWNRKAAKRVPVQSGWRGRACVGAFSSIGRNYE